VIHGDALALPPERFAADAPWQAVGNLPFSVATRSSGDC